MSSSSTLGSWPHCCLFGRVPLPGHHGLVGHTLLSVRHGLIRCVLLPASLCYHINNGHVWHLHLTKISMYLFLLTALSCNIESTRASCALPGHVMTSLAVFCSQSKYCLFGHILLPSHYGLSVCAPLPVHHGLISCFLLPATLWHSQTHLAPLCPDFLSHVVLPATLLPFGCAPLPGHHGLVGCTLFPVYHSPVSHIFLPVTLLPSQPCSAHLCPAQPCRDFLGHVVLPVTLFSF